jgi:4-hydroxy-2-oxoglutarate aldolase
MEMPSNEAVGATNGQAATTMAFPGGIHVPSLTFFSNDARQEVDWETQEKHFEFLISSGLHGSEYSAF